MSVPGWHTGLWRFKAWPKAIPLLVGFPAGLMVKRKGARVGRIGHISKRLVDNPEFQNFRLDRPATKAHSPLFETSIRLAQRSMGWGMMATQTMWQHAYCDRRAGLKIGSLGLLGLGMNHLLGLQEAQGVVQPMSCDMPASIFGKAKSCIFIFLSGGLAQHESFDMKPLAPDTVRGEFQPIATSTPGIRICEHLPLLAARSDQYALCRSLTHSSNDHSLGHHIMQTGRSGMPSGFDPNHNSRMDEPSMVAIANRLLKPRNNLPSAAILPERLVHTTGRIIPGQHAGKMGAAYDPWCIAASPFHRTSYGAFPQHAFDHQQRGLPDSRQFEAPHLTLDAGLSVGRFQGRVGLLGELNRQRAAWDRAAAGIEFDRLRQSAISLMTHVAVEQAMDVTRADESVQEAYGKNSFGWSLLMARRLVTAGVRLIQVNLGNNESWDTHGNAFPHLKEKLLPPTDRALSALLDDLASTGELEETLIVMAGEFGRTPKISLLAQHYKQPGRDHWGAVQSILVAGAGTRGGTVVGASDSQGGYPADRPVTPEEFAATIYHALGIPAEVTWHDAEDRPHQVYHGVPVSEFFA